MLALGEPMDADLLGDLALPEALDGLEAAGLVAVQREGRRADARLAHPLYGEVLRATVRPIAARARRRLADALSARGLDRGDDVLRVATWRLEAGQAVAPSCSGWRPSTRWISATTCWPADWPRNGSAAGGGTRARLAAGAALAGQRLPEEAEEVLAPLAAAASDDEEIALVAMARAANLMMGLGRPERSAEVLRRASESIADDGWRDRVAAHRACLLLFLAPCEEVVQAASAPLRALRRRPPGGRGVPACRGARHGAGRAARAGPGAGGSRRAGRPPLPLRASRPGRTTCCWRAAGRCSCPGASPMRRSSPSAAGPRR